MIADTQDNPVTEWYEADYDPSPENHRDFHSNWHFFVKWDDDKQCWSPTAQEELDDPSNMWTFTGGTDAHPPPDPAGSAVWLTDVPV